MFKAVNAVVVFVFIFIIVIKIPLMICILFPFIVSSTYKNEEAKKAKNFRILI